MNDYLQLLSDLFCSLYGIESKHFHIIQHNNCSIFTYIDHKIDISEAFLLKINQILKILMIVYILCISYKF